MHKLAVQALARVDAIFTYDECMVHMQGMCDGPVIESIGEQGTTSVSDWAYYKVQHQTIRSEQTTEQLILRSIAYHCLLLCVHHKTIASLDFGWLPGSPGGMASVRPQSCQKRFDSTVVTCAGASVTDH